jgi:acyl carrier protein phosphodiesterase
VLFLEHVNYLAHFLLAFGDSELLTGQFIADAVKGRNFEGYPERVTSGILLHRHIDHFTDTHPECLRLRELIRPELGLFSSIAIDIYFDHMLALSWPNWHSSPLNQFAHTCYSALAASKHQMPERMIITLDYMSRHDWLTHYSTLTGIERSFRGLSTRVTGGERLLMAIPVLHREFPAIQQSFALFFPELLESSKLKLSTFAPGNLYG